MYEYLLLILLLLEWRPTVCTSSPTLEDNMLPTDEEVLSDLINSYRRGQPEEEIALNLPTDEEAFNEIKPILQSGNPFYYINGGGHFISSSFPEIDARGFHESVFDDLDDFYPISQRGKKYDASSLAVSARGFYGDVFTDGFGNFHPVKRYYKDREENSRQKRSYRLEDVSEKLPLFSDASTSSPQDQSSISKHIHRQMSHHCSSANCSLALWDIMRMEQSPPTSYENSSTTLPTHGNHTKMASTRHKRSPSRQYDWSSMSVQFLQPKGEKPRVKFSHAASILGNSGKFHRLRKRSRQSSGFSKRVPEISKSGFHNDVFHNQFGKFDTLKRDPSGFHGDVFHKSFGKFETLRKRNRDEDVDWRSFYTPKRRPQLSGVNTDAFYSNFGNFETLKRTPPVLGFDDDDPDDHLSNYDQYPKRGPHSPILNGDAFHSNFGTFDTMKRTLAGDAFHSNFGAFDTMKRTLGGDAFHSNFGRFEPMKRTLGGDAFHSSFGAFDPMKRTLAGDAFHSNFGAFDTMKRTLAGDAFHSNFGAFDPMKRTLGGDAFHSNFGTFDTMKRTLGGDAFHSQFGRFETMKRAPEMDSAGFGEDDAFSRQFGAFDTLKRGSAARAYAATGRKSDEKAEQSEQGSRFRRFVQNRFVTSKSKNEPKDGSSRSQENESTLDLIRSSTSSMRTD